MSGYWSLSLNDKGRKGHVSRLKIRPLIKSFQPSANLYLGNNTFQFHSYLAASHFHNQPGRVSYVNIVHKISVTINYRDRNMLYDNIHVTRSLFYAHLLYTYPLHLSYTHLTNMISTTPPHPATHSATYTPHPVTHTPTRA